MTQTAKDLIRVTCSIGAYLAIGVVTTGGLYGGFALAVITAKDMMGY